MVRVVSATVVFMMVAVAASFGAASAKEHDAEPRAAYTLKPVADGSDVVALEVTVQLGGVEGGPDRALMELPLVSWNVPTVAASLARIEAIDATGPVALVARDEGQDATAVRRWYPERPTVGPVMVRYAARPAVEDAPRGAAPPVDLRAEEGAISGGAAIVLLRAAVPSAHLTLDWDLSALPVGSAALSSPLPVGTDSASAHPLEQVYFMAGRLHRYPEDATGHGFFSAWQGTPPLDARALMQWTGALYGHYEQFFGTSPAPYGVFLRRNPVNAGGGMGMNRSFIVTFGAGAGSDPTELKFTLAHEMFHTFQPTMKAPEELSSAWFNEGLAVYYQRVLPLRYGLIDADAFLKDLNFHAARYYTSALGNVPNSEIPARFWKDTRIRTLPYDRGFLYLVTVDEAVRRASKGRRSLDDLMLA
ncbi:MAG TPA: hypothetical protein VMT50_06135, partial [Steroidobacteraceae bacterium]|nr:hypothetical protein [Steroidobacteraceae bacterium]